MAQKQLRIGIVAGEASGDILAAGLIKSLKQIFPDAIFEGIAGPQMQAEGCRSLFEMEELSVMGLVEVLSRIRRLLHVRDVLVQHFTDNPPDVFVGVDAPDFNLRVEQQLKQQGIRTVHYVSPTVWAWRENRIHKIANATNLVLGLFPFEHEVYDRYQVPYQFVGHTLADEVPMHPDQNAARASLGLPLEKTVLGLLPGSRKGEVNSLLPTFIGAAEELATQIPELKVVIPVVNDLRRQQVEDLLAAHPNKLDVTLVDGQSRQVMIAADVILLASGTATLEALLCKRPMVVAYKMNWLTYKIMQRIYKAKFFSLPNLLADEAIVPELLQQDVNPVNLAEHLYRVMHEDVDKLQKRYERIHASLRRDADKQAAAAVCRILDKGIECHNPS